MTGEATLFATKLSLGGTAVEFVTCDIAETRETLLDDDGIRGQRSMQLERTAQGLIKVGGTIKMHPTPAELALIWPFLVQSSTGATLTDLMQDCAVILDTQTKTYSFTGRISKGVLSGRPGKKLDLTLTYVGYSCTVSAGGSVGGTPDIANGPYMMSQLGSGVTIAGTAYLIDEFELEIDNMIDPTFMQGQTATDLYPTGRKVGLSIRTKYTSTESGLLTVAQAGQIIASPLVASLAFTDGANSASFAFGALVADSKTVVATEKKLRLPLKYHCLKVGSTLEVVTTLA